MQDLLTRYKPLSQYKRKIYEPFVDPETGLVIDLSGDIAGVGDLHDDDPSLDHHNKIGSHHLEFRDEADMATKLKNKWWRLNNLYYIINAKGNKVLFKPNYSQWMFYNNIWYMNLILKARQLGFTTFIDIYLLDECLFNANIEAGIIAHNREDAGKILRRKVLFPYNNLPTWLKEQRPLITKSKSELEFKHSGSDSSVLSIGTSFRSGTCHYLHISEFGKICAQYPAKAEEIVSGALEAIHTETEKCVLFIESTAEGRQGFFFDYCTEAQKRQLMNMRLSSLDYRFHFFPWYENPGNSVSTNQPIIDRMATYFARMEAEIGERLTQGQKNWYVLKEAKLGDLMKREHPFSPKEAFEQAIMGAYFASQFEKIRMENRICSVPHDVGATVDTWWDLGIGDAMAIWFTQNQGRQIHVIDYLENSGEGIEFYAQELAKKRLELGYDYGTHNGPHDVSKREIGTGVDIWTSAARVGINFRRIPRVKQKRDSINSARTILNLCWFDHLKCAKGIQRMEAYRKEWNPFLGCYRDSPFHDVNSNCADAFQTLGMGHKFGIAPAAAAHFNTIRPVSAAGWT